MDNSIGQKTGGTSNYNTGYGLAIDSSNNIYQTGQISGSNYVFNNQVGDWSNGTPAFLSKYDVKGNFIWNKIIGNSIVTGNDDLTFNTGISLTINYSKEILLTGYFKDNINFNFTHIKSYGAPDLLFMKFNLDGEILSANQYSYYGWVAGSDITLDKNENVYITGLNSFDLWSLPNFGFIGKIDKSIPFNFLSIDNNHSQLEFTLSPNPSNGIVNFDFGQNNEKKEIEIYSSIGEKLFKNIIFDKKFSTTILENGVYYIQIKINNLISNK
ncbi:MAG: T9SS type A sorting domain-containing protein, partial [Bacteroidetes bacterium]|nr:T9SS type A sorting domain-containing protein [Bacteroidota bacterium]